MNEHNHNDHKPMFTNQEFRCSCGKQNTECHPCRHPKENCYYLEVGCQHPRRCESFSGPYPVEITK